MDTASHRFNSARRLTSLDHMNDEHGHICEVKPKPMPALDHA